MSTKLFSKNLLHIYVSMSKVGSFILSQELLIVLPFPLIYYYNGNPFFSSNHICLFDNSYLYFLQVIFVEEY